MRIFSSAPQQSETDGSQNLDQARRHTPKNSKSQTAGVPQNEYVDSFVPEYILDEIKKNTRDPIILRGIEQARQDMRQVDLGKNPSYLEKIRAKELFERVRNGEDPATFSQSDRDILSKFASWLKRLFDAIFGSKKTPSPTDEKEKRTGSRYMYDAQSTQTLRKALVRTEGQSKVGDSDVDGAYDYAGNLRSFMRDVLHINSFDNANMNMHQTVHYGSKYANAFWNGQEMAYGDGDGTAFSHFAQDPSVIFHEMGHGIVQFHNKNGGLNYSGESGALNESFADINAVTVMQYQNNTTVENAARDMWLIGAKCMVPFKDKSGNMQYPALRSFLNEKAYQDHPMLGTDKQPKFMKDKYTGSGDNGGVHYNSGITNYAFYLAAQAIGGKVWLTTYQIWYDALAGVPSNCTFQQFALATVESALKLVNNANQNIKKDDVEKVTGAWKTVGVLSAQDNPKINELFKKYGYKPVQTNVGLRQAG